MRKIIALLAGLSLAASAVAPAAGPKFSTSGGVGSADSTFVGGEPNGGTYTINGTTGTVSTPVVNLRPGPAPASPQNGDCWTTTAGFFCRINGATLGPYQANPPSVTSNFVFAGPNGSSGAPSFRALAGGDIPATVLSASGNGGVSGTLGLANGGTGGTSAATARSSLGLGTAATQNTGTSGATVPLLNGGNTWSAAQTFSQDLTVSKASAPNINISGPVATNRALRLQTAGSTRWSLIGSSAAESGSNAGSNFNISRYDDAGSFLDIPFEISRATGTTTLRSPLQLTATAAPYVDLTGANTDVAGGTYLANENAFSYYPIVGWQTGDFQRAQALIRFKSQYNVVKSETGLAIDTYVNTGYAPAYATSTAYTANQYVVVPASNYIYQVGSACTSGASAPVWPSSGSVANGTCTFTWRAFGQQNAKMPLFVQTVADAGAGNTWSGVFNTIWKNGYRGQFGASVEIDATNNSGVDLPTHSGIYLASGGGSNEVGVGLTIAGHPGKNFTDAIAIGGEAASQSDFHTYSQSKWSYLDNGVHDYGLYLNGTYAQKAAFFGGTTSNTNGTGTDQGQVMISPNGGTSRLQMGYVYQAGVKEYGRIQSSNGVAATSLYLNPGGGIVYIGSGLMQIAPSAVATLPTCNAGATGTVAYVTDANAPAWNATLVGGGSVRTLALCNGTNWTAR